MIIPYQELLGNYNSLPPAPRCGQIIPYQELLGNYNRHVGIRHPRPIIPYQELLGNYNWPRCLFPVWPNYTIPRTVRELQRRVNCTMRRAYYTIPRTVRELQPIFPRRVWTLHYTIPRTVRELQPECGHESANGIIPYQELPGVYQRGETPATYPFFQNKMRALFSAFSLFFACT